VIGLSPHTMTTADWLFVALFQLGLIVLAAPAVWLAVSARRQGGRQ
jgi:hypothetical protein